MLRRALAVAAAAAAAASTGSAATTGFRSSIRPLSASLRDRMTGVSWHPGCPVPLSGLRLLTVVHWGFDGRVHTGRLVVNATAARQLRSVFRRLYDERFPIRRMRLVDDYGGSDFRSIEADNTSAFNCRNATGSSHWSMHAYGLAIDVNPIENPYVSGGTTSHHASLPYLDRNDHRPGMAYPGGVLVDAFRSIGWGWGGDWSGIKDYQHFSATGG